MRFWPRWCKREKNRAEAQEAIERERKARRDIDSAALEIEAKRHIINKLAESVIDARNRNHFADLVRRSLS